MKAYGLYRLLLTIQQVHAGVPGDYAMKAIGILLVEIILRDILPRTSW